MWVSNPLLFRAKLSVLNSRLMVTVLRVGFIIRLRLILSFFLQCVFFSVAWHVGVAQLVFSCCCFCFFPEQIILYVAVDLVCLREKATLESSCIIILNGNPGDYHIRKLNKTSVRRRGPRHRNIVVVLRI